jgi:hypothetical protein
MKKFTLCLLMILSQLPFVDAAVKSNNSSTQYFIVRVTYSLKKTGVTSNFFIEEIRDKGHQLYGRVVVEQDVVIRFTMDDGKTEAATTDSEMLNILSRLGWTLYEMHAQKVLNNDYWVYMFTRN